MYGRDQDFCLRSIIVKHLTEYQNILWYKRSKNLDFGPDFVKWVSVPMADAKSCVAYCGWISEYFAVEAGIRQGCPFSPLAFVLAVELLAIKIRHCENIKGLNGWKGRNSLWGSIIKIALYADEITLFLKDEQDMQQALKTVS